MNFLGNRHCEFVIGRYATNDSAILKPRVENPWLPVIGRYATNDSAILKPRVENPWLPVIGRYATITITTRGYP